MASQHSSPVQTHYYFLPDQSNGSPSVVLLNLYPSEAKVIPSMYKSHHIVQLPRVPHQ